MSPKDTVYLITSPVSFYFNLNTHKLKINNVNVFLDDLTIYQGTSSTGNFTIDPFIHGSGERILTLAVTTNTNSNSLADIIGWEGLIFIKQWKVNIDGSPPGPVKITQITNDNGLLKLEWEPYERINFQKYRIYVNYPEHEGPYYYHLLAEISDQKKTWWHDSTYIGGSASYWVEVMASGNNVSGERTHISFPHPVLDTLWTKGDDVCFGWNRCRFHRAFDKYELETIKILEPDLGEIILTSENVNDTIYLVSNFRFGSTITYTLKCSSKKQILSDGYPNSTFSKCHAGIGSIIPKHTAIRYSITNPVLYLQNHEFLTKVSLSEAQPLMQMDNMTATYWTITPDDRYLLTKKGSEIKKYDCNSFSYIKTYDENQPAIPNGEFGNISLQGTMVIWRWDGWGLYDFLSDRYIFSGKNQELHGAEISPDGAYAFTKQYIDSDRNAIIVNKVTDTSLVELGRIPEGPYGTITWLQEDFSRLLVIQDGNYSIPQHPGKNIVRIFNAEDQSVVYEFEANYGNFCGIDPESNLLGLWVVCPGTYYKHKVYLYNYKTGNLFREINLAPSFDILTLYKSHLISSGGYCLSISELSR